MLPRVLPENVLLRGAALPVSTELIVLLALLGIAQHVVRFVDLLEALGRLRVIGIAVGMVLLRQPAERLLDVVGGRRLGDTEDLIVVLAGHQPVVSGAAGPSPRHCRTATRAGRISASPSR